LASIWLADERVAKSRVLVAAKQVETSQYPVWQKVWAFFGLTCHDFFKVLVP